MSDILVETLQEIGDLVKKANGNRVVVPPDVEPGTSYLIENDAGQLVEAKADPYRLRVSADSLDGFRDALEVSMGLVDHDGVVPVFGTRSGMEAMLSPDQLDRVLVVFRFTSEWAFLSSTQGGSPKSLSEQIRITLGSVMTPELQDFCSKLRHVKFSSSESGESRYAVGDESLSVRRDSKLTDKDGNTLPESVTVTAPVFENVAGAPGMPVTMSVLVNPEDKEVRLVPRQPDVEHAVVRVSGWAHAQIASYFDDLKEGRPVRVISGACSVLTRPGPQPAQAQVVRKGPF